MKLLVASFCLLAAALPVCGQTLQNPSFEEQGDGPDLAAHWNRWGQWINRETDWSPTHTGKCLVGYHHWQIENGENSGIWQEVTGATPGQRFRFTVFVWVDKADAPAREIELRLEATHGDHQLTIESVTFPVKQMPTGQWFPISVTGTTPENHVRVLVVVSPSSNAPREGAVKFDDAKLEVIADDKKQATH
jgi:hypothetical protein